MSDYTYRFAFEIFQRIFVRVGTPNSPFPVPWVPQKIPTVTRETCKINSIMIGQHGGVPEVDITFQKWYPRHGRHTMLWHGSKDLRTRIPSHSFRFVTWTTASTWTMRKKRLRPHPSALKEGPTPKLERPTWLIIFDFHADKVEAMRASCVGLEL